MPQWLNTMPRTDFIVRSVNKSSARTVEKILTTWDLVVKNFKKTKPKST